MHILLTRQLEDSKDLIQKFKSNGFKVSAKIDLEKNKFIDGLDLSDAGTLVENFKDNNLARFQGDFTYHYELPWVERLTTSLYLNGGYITNTEVDSFFHFPFFVFSDVPRW